MCERQRRSVIVLTGYFLQVPAFIQQRARFLNRLFYRIQFERTKEALIPSIREYARYFGLDESKLADLPEGFMVMHPGPMNRGTEISHDVAERHSGTILRQVSNGVAVRMAVLYLLSGGEARN